MTQNDPELYDLTRRKVLGGLTAVGVASIGAGLGTSAYFSDVETYENNVLTAGALDFVVDWEEHYYRGGITDIDLRYSIADLDEADQSSYVGFPNPDSPLVYVHQDDIAAFMDATSLEAYPDSDDDGIQDLLEEYDACDDFAQLSDNLDPTEGRGAGKRSLNDDTVTNLQDVLEEGAPADWKPLVSLDDVKPGDFGELTLSMHLCDNPGYIWLQGALVEAAENGHTEPEASDPDEVGGPNTSNATGEDVELLDAIQTMLWYDEDGDNVYEPGGAADDADVVIVLDRSGSMGSGQGSKLENAKDGAELLVAALGDQANVGVVSFDDDITQEIGLTNLGVNRSGVVSAIQGISGPGSTTNIESAIDTAQSMLAGGSSNTEIMVLLSDGAPNVDGDGDDENDPIFDDADPADNATVAKNAGTEIYTIGYDLPSQDTVDLMEEMASMPKASHAYTDVDFNDVQNVFSQIGQIIAGEECFFQGSLGTLLDLVEPDPGNDEFGIPLDGIRASPFDEITGDDTSGDGQVDSNYGLGAGDDPNRNQFVDSTTNALGLAWWLPVDHANEIQTDSVTFDLGFYTEQARHNSGAGQA